MKVCVVGLGKIGLPLAVQIASMGHDVVGADIDPHVADLVSAGEPPFPGEAELPERLRRVVADGRLTATSETEAAVSRSEVVIVVVPLVVDEAGAPQFDAMDAATQSVGGALQPGSLVSYETTLPVGTTRGRFAPALEAGSGLRAGSDFWVCHSPERVFTGRVFQDLRRYPKLVGGVDTESGRRAVQFYESALEFDERSDLDRANGVWDLGSVEAAELAKLAETTYRDLNIAYANELAVYSEQLGIDVNRVIDASNSQPFSHIHRPGVAVGGHCIPVYPHFMLAGATSMQLPRVARDVNSGMPAHVVGRLEQLRGSLVGLSIVVLGAAYRGDVKETAFSGVFELVRALERGGASPLIHDPMFDRSELLTLGLQPYELGQPCDAVILQADHSSYRKLGPKDFPGARVLIDGRGILDVETFAESPIRYVRLGVGEAE